MIKKGLFLLLLIQFQSVFGQKTLQQIIDEVPYSGNHYSSYGYSDRAIEKQNILSIQNETQVLKQLKLPPLDHSEYFITGKYEINNLIVLFFSEYWDTENVHFALLLDKSLNIIDRLDETAYDNAEGFYGVTSYVDYNIITTTVNNIYNTPEYFTKQYTITNKGFKAIKDQVIINTPSGIRIRKKPTTNSDVVTSAPNLAVFNYLSHSDNTSVFDNGKYLKDHWLEIAEKDSTIQLGYVFGAFAKRRIELTTNDYQVVLNEISQKDFNEEFRRKNNNTSS